MAFIRKIFIRVSILLYQKSGGLLGSRLGNQKILLLQTVGRKSGKTFISPLAYFRDGENYLIVASNWGSETPPNWYKNISRMARTTIQVGSRIIAVEARSAEGIEYERLWKLVSTQSPFYAKYQEDLVRRIPVVVLAPVEK